MCGFLFGISETIDDLFFVTVFLTQTGKGYNITSVTPTEATSSRLWLLLLYYTTRLWVEISEVKYIIP